MKLPPCVPDWPCRKLVRDGEKPMEPVESDRWVTPVGSSLRERNPSGELQKLDTFTDFTVMSTPD